MLKEFSKDKLLVKIFESRDEMGKVAADMVAQKICELQEKKSIRMIFAAAPSQNEILKHLVSNKQIKWENITAFHMDEYIGIENTAPQKFSNFLKERLFDKVPFKAVHLIDSSANAEDEVKRYSSLLTEDAIDIVCLGVGENGHIAFNDPPVADFEDKQIVKVVELENACRVQQVNDGCFDSVDKVPTKALTLTIPALTNSNYMYCVVPSATKAQAVTNMINDEISINCPASILRKHDNCTMFLDKDSGAKLL